jgi:hypothetical protein
VITALAIGSQFGLPHWTIALPVGLVVGVIYWFRFWWRFKPEATQIDARMRDRRERVAAAEAVHPRLRGRSSRRRNGRGLGASRA